MDMLEIIAVFNFFDKSYGYIRDLPEDTFLSFLGLLIDQWASDHGLDSEGTFNLLTALTVVQKDVHNELGIMSPSF